MDGFPAEYCRVVVARMHEDDAYVLLNTGSTAQPYLYGVNCRRENGRWFEGSSGNGGGWQQTGDDPDVGTLSVWGDAPAGVAVVWVEFEGNSIAAPVSDGAYLMVWWRVPAPRRFPRVTGFD
jgi:hypothetical protein